MPRAGPVAPLIPPLCNREEPPQLEDESGKVGHWAEVCPTLDTRLRDRLAAAMRWSPLGAHSGSYDTKRMGRQVAFATPNKDSISSGDVSAPLEKGESSGWVRVRTGNLL